MRRKTRTFVASWLALLLGAGVYFLYAPPAVAPGGEVRELIERVGDRERRFLVHSPKHLEAGASLLIAFHPSQSSGEAMRGIVGPFFEGIAARDQLVIAYPVGFDGHWNDCRRVASYRARTENIDDLGFVRALIARLVREEKIDPAKVHAVGFSNGGQMVIRLALEAPELLRGGIAIGAQLPAPENMDCVPAATPPSRLVFIAGTKDPISPYGGGRVTLFGFGDRGRVLSAEASGEWFAQRLALVSGTRRELSPAEGGPGLEMEWHGTGAAVRVVRLEGAGHTVPQAGYRFPRIFGGTVLNDAVLASAWAMFRSAD